MGSEDVYKRQVYSQLAYMAESGPWRNFYLTGAQELQHGITLEHMTGRSSSDDILTNLSLENFYDFMAVRLDSSQAENKQYTFNLIFPDIQESISLYLNNSVLHNRPDVLAKAPDATITMNKSTFNDIITKRATGMEKRMTEEITIEGNAMAYADFQKMVGKPFKALFNIIEP